LSLWLKNNKNKEKNKMILDDLKELEKKSITVGIPIIGPNKGKWLYDKIVELKPKNILEIGTATGYSGIILGHLGANLTTIDQDKKAQAEAKKNFDEFKINSEIINGNGVEEVKKLSKEKSNVFDLIFIDFAKKRYIDVLEYCIDLVKVNGYIIADNIDLDGCQNFKTAVMNHPKLNTEIIDIEDELSCSEKIKD
jgi:predicted O-methyltransferase YrrM